MWLKFYIGVHFIALLVTFHASVVDPGTVHLVLLTAYVAATVFVFGALLDDSPQWIGWLELIRCTVSLVTHHFVGYDLIWKPIFNFVFFNSVVIWSCIVHNQYLRYYKQPDNRSLYLKKK